MEGRMGLALWKNFSVRCIGCLLLVLTGCALFQEEEVTYLKEAESFMPHKTRSNDGWEPLVSPSP